MKKSIKGVCLYLALIAGATAAGNDNVQLSNLHFQSTQNGLQIIQGLGQNTSSKTLANVIIKINLLKDDVVIGQAGDFVTNIEPGQKFVINASYNSIELHPDSFKVTEVTALQK